MNKREIKFGIDINKISEKSWSFGICVSHSDEETYLYINFFKWNISIGKMYFADKGGEDDE